ncbi:MAG TPA: MATE family efflux transporter, partial [Longimicrobium sp.]
MKPVSVAGGRRRRRLFLHEVRALAWIAGPIVVSQLGGIAMNTTDTIMLGRLGPTALAAAGLASAVQMALVVMCNGVVMGMLPLVSQAYGAGDRDECRRVLVQGLWLALALAVPATLICVSGRRLALLLGQAPEVASVAGDYLAALAPGVLPVMLFMAFRQYLEGMGITRAAMWMSFVGIVLNALGNWALIWGVPGLVPPMGVVGSGMATSGVRWAMLAGMFAFVVRHPGLHPFRAVSLRPVAERLRRIVGLGVPVGAQLGAEVGIFSLTAVMMGWLGPVELAAHQVTINVASTTYMVPLGASIAGSIRVGQHVGAGNPRGVHRAALATYLVAMAFMSVCALLFITIPEVVIGLYTADPRIVRVATTLLVLAAIFQLFDGAQAAGICVLRGAADTRIPMWITLIGYWGVGFPVAYLLGFHTPLGYAGIWTGLVASLAVVALLMGLRVRSVLWSGRFTQRHGG